MTKKPNAVLIDKDGEEERFVAVSVPPPSEYLIAVSVTVSVRRLVEGPPAMSSRQARRFYLASHRPNHDGVYVYFEESQR